MITALLRHQSCQMDLEREKEKNISHVLSRERLLLTFLYLKKNSITPLSVISLDSRPWAWEAKSFPRKHNWLVLAFIIRCVINGSSSTDLCFFSCFPPKIVSCACWKKYWGRFCLYVCHPLQFTYFLQAAPKLYMDRSVS